MESTLLFLNVGEIRTAYRVYGDGDFAFVLLHGWGGNSQSFEKLAPLLSQELNARVIVPDIPGFGSSDTPSYNGFKIADYTQWFHEFLKELHISNPFLYGHSFGCRVLVDYVSQFPSSTPLILTGAAGIVIPLPWWKRCIRALGYRFRFFKKILPKSFYFFFLRRVLKAHDWANVSENMKKTFQNVLNEPDVREKLKNISNPTLLLWGKKDTYTPLSSGYIFHSSLSHSQLVVFEGGRHGIHYTHTADIVHHIRQFLSPSL